ncbi:transmembrane CLPTM1 family protein [Babesia caballi]|uniref:Transmembrane CLPTM1 family protein n=1 Tax=Babesia caballi TaxID=5871 RepID=A0AAV4LV78_BABCB|nr:transmembrane CLPTM1 family protein [Babesia caballi]
MAAASAPQERRSNQRNWIFQAVLQVIAIHVLLSFFGGNKRNQVDPATGKPPVVYRNYLSANDLFDTYIYVSREAYVGLEFLGDSAELVFSAENRAYSHSFNRAFDVTAASITPDSSFFHNDYDQLYAIVFVVPHKSYATRAVPFHESTFKQGFEGHVVVQSIPLTTMRRVKHSKEVSLIGSPASEPEEGPEEEVRKHWIPRLDVNLVYDTAAHVQNPKDVYFNAYQVYEAEGVYDPLVYLSQFWVLEEHYQCVRPEMDGSSLELQVHFSTCSPTYYLMSTQFKVNSETGGILGQQSAKEFEMFKRTLMTTNVYMLIFSGAFILLHSIFSFFALKNDIQFWHQTDSMEGLSALSVLINFACDIIVALYIFDSENVSWLILFEISIGLVASAWKVSKAISIKLKPQFPFLELGNAKNYVESNTKKYDEMAIKYMSVVMLPCVLGYAIYSLFYQKYKSWYSYIISVAAGSVYTFGFIMMTPQIYINYKLKSVDHLPWRALIYKSLNTFVDDVASFLIDMPWMHRLSCFRDDIIFFCYLYQRWAYRVDPSRPNAWKHANAEAQAVSAGATEVSSATDSVPATAQAESPAEEVEGDAQPVRRSAKVPHAPGRQHSVRPLGDIVGGRDRPRYALVVLAADHRPLGEDGRVAEHPELQQLLLAGVDRAAHLARRPVGGVGRSVGELGPQVQPAGPAHVRGDARVVLDAEELGHRRLPPRPVDGEPELRGRVRDHGRAHGLRTGDVAEQPLAHKGPQRGDAAGVRQRGRRRPKLEGAADNVPHLEVLK